MNLGRDGETHQEPEDKGPMTLKGGSSQLIDPGGKQAHSRWGWGAPVRLLRAVRPSRTSYRKGS